jgi:hypothetical protein
MIYDGLTDREVLIIVADRMERLDRAVHGNGQPGLVSRLAAVEQEVDVVTRRNSPAGKTERFGIAGAVIAGGLGLIAKMLGFPVPL